METECVRIKTAICNQLGNQLIKSLIKSLVKISPIVTPIILLISCEGNQRFYRPNLPEKLCSIGIIDLDDTLLHHISFEKSFQREYVSEVYSQLNDFSFKIYTDREDIFNYQINQSPERYLQIELPGSIWFNPDEKYYLYAKEKDSPDITAEVTVPGSPSEPELISINYETIELSSPPECGSHEKYSSASINFSFEIDNQHRSYYVIILEGTGYTLGPTDIFLRRGFLDYTVRECNNPGFFSIFPYLKVYNLSCKNDSYIENPLNAYFIDGDQNPENRCNITISTQFGDGYSRFYMIKSFRIILLSVSEEFYLFEKNLFKYNKVRDDPFSEPVYLNGNIKGGNGVFAICRSTSLNIRW